MFGFLKPHILPALTAVERTIDAVAEGHTSLGGNFYAMIAADIRYDIVSEVSNGSSVLTSNKNLIFSGNEGPNFGDAGNKVNINTFSVGIKLGVSYFF